MRALYHSPIDFPGLFGGLTFNPDPKLLDIGNGIYWYGVIIMVGVLLALLFGCKQSPKYGITEDEIYGGFIWALPLSLVGARLYYVIFYLDLYRNADGSLNWAKMIAIWDGGIAIYGAIIAVVITVWIYCKSKKIAFGSAMDLLVMGLLIGQAVGRWGNFFNREAFGTVTDLPWRMGLMLVDNQYVEVHPTFLYESLWNLIGFLLIFFVVSKLRSFDGENACFYFIWYSFGRFWIEGLRTDSLYLFDLTIAGYPVRVSQAVSVVIFVAAALYMAVRRSRNPDPADLFVTRRLMAEAEAQSEQFLAEQESAVKDSALLDAMDQVAQEAAAEVTAVTEESSDVPAAEDEAAPAEETVSEDA